MTDRVAPHPRDEVRECPRCEGSGDREQPAIDGTWWCFECNGRGYVVGRWKALGETDASPGAEARWIASSSQDVIEVKRWDGEWRWRTNDGPWRPLHFNTQGVGVSTEPEVIRAARCAYWGVGPFPDAVITCAEGCCHFTPDAALAAAIDAKEE